MDLRKAAVTAAETLATTVAGVFTPAPASAYPTMSKFGSEQPLCNADATVATQWRVGSLEPSDDPMPFPVTGQLWKAVATATAVHGETIPAVSNFTARTDDGHNYSALDKAPSPPALAPSPLSQGDSATGAVYFDVSGPPPTSVVYHSGGQDLLIWS
ncbi:immunogenic protein MPT63 [Mycolicibacterium brisbanense]|uniref:Immunogenic protein MPT63 n=2 Tax=Mycolicibacterium brisbanense TaxID=146020 RepID=A0A100W4Y2_9MYCO|nr:immunogenic protein MPT63 [Mycolicibacterium brisbanense]